MKLIGDDTTEVQANWVIRQLKALPTGLRILDAGAGERRFEPYCSHLQYVSQDFGQYDGGGDGAGLQTGKWDNSRLDIVSDITRIPVEDASFDAILCSEVFEHIPDAITAVREFARILKPGGTLLITAPFNSLTHFAPYHFCGYNRYWYLHHLPALGLEIEIIDHNGSWFAFIAQELRRSRLGGADVRLRATGPVNPRCRHSVACAVDSDGAPRSRVAGTALLWIHGAGDKIDRWCTGGGNTIHELN